MILSIPGAFKVLFRKVHDDSSLRKFVFPCLVSLRYVVHRNMFNVLFIYQIEISLSDYVGKENAFSASLDSECAPDLVFCDLNVPNLIVVFLTKYNIHLDQALKTVKVFQT